MKLLMAIIPVPDTKTMDAIERFGHIVNGVGVPLIMVLFIAVYFGWLTSPTTTAIDKNRVLIEKIAGDLNKHETEMQLIFKTSTQHNADMNATILRLIDLIKLIDCADITDKQLRDRCMAR